MKQSKWTVDEKLAIVMDGSQGEEVCYRHLSGA
jgi:hypothetical protein